ncbi:MAG TPA: ABC transporter permease subunit, partial [Stellaceae bacterium]|nr:ABC transporter permease subunit [Stellaceae bacterium]
MVTDTRHSIGSSKMQRVWWREERFRFWAFQIGAVAATVIVIGYFWHNALVNMERQGIATGFGFLSREAGFEISLALIPYSPADTYGRALLIGLLNTLVVSAIGCVLTTIIGVLLGIARLSSNWLLRKVTLWYVEIFRNTPLLLQLVVWWDLLRYGAPGPRQALQVLPNIFASNRGVTFPVLNWHEADLWVVSAFILGILATVCLARWAKHRQERTGAQFPTISVGVGLIVLLPLAVFFAAGAPLDL